MGRVVPWPERQLPPHRHDDDSPGGGAEGKRSRRPLHRHPGHLHTLRRVVSRRPAPRGLDPRGTGRPYDAGGRRPDSGAQDPMPELQRCPRSVPRIQHDVPRRNWSDREGSGLLAARDRTGGVPELQARVRGPPPKAPDGIGHRRSRLPERNQSATGGLPDAGISPGGTPDLLRSRDVRRRVALRFDRLGRRPHRVGGGEGQLGGPRDPREGPRHPRVALLVRVAPRAGPAVLPRHPPHSEGRLPVGRTGRQGTRILQQDSLRHPGAAGEPRGFKEVGGVHYRTDHDLKGHEAGSHTKQSVTVGTTKLLPHVLELSFGVDRNVWALLDLSYAKGDRVVLRLPARVAPVPVAVFPLVNKDGIPERAEALWATLRKRIAAFYDDSGSIGRRYARIDEIGTPFSVTVDHETLEGKGVTVRERDSQKQFRVSEGELADTIERLLSGESTFPA